MGYAVEKRFSAHHQFSFGKLMKCDTCQQESEIIMRVVVAQGYNRSLARPLLNCPACFEKKEQSKSAQGSGLRAPGSSPEPRTPSQEPNTGGVR